MHWGSLVIYLLSFIKNVVTIQPLLRIVHSHCSDRKSSNRCVRGSEERGSLKWMVSELGLEEEESFYKEGVTKWEKKQNQACSGEERLKVGCWLHHSRKHL